MLPNQYVFMLAVWCAWCVCSVSSSSGSL